MIKAFISIFIISSSAFAASGHAPTTWSEFFPTLIGPAFNVFLLGSLLIWKLKKPTKDMFIEKSKNIAQIMERASVKAKEAEMMLQMQQKKIDGLDSEISKMNSEVESDINDFKSGYAKEVEERIAKLKIDAASKIDAEKKGLTAELNAALLEQVISQAKSVIRSNKDLNEKATSKILEGL